MIIGAHAIIYSRDAEADRAFIRDVLGFDSVDAGGGWLIFALPPAEVAVHPDDAGDRHELYLMCDDLEATAAPLGITGPVTELRWGRLMHVALPSGAQLGLYEPKHPTAITKGCPTANLALTAAPHRDARPTRAIPPKRRCAR